MTKEDQLSNMLDKTKLAIRTLAVTFESIDRELEELRQEKPCEFKKDCKNWRKFCMHCKKTIYVYRHDKIARALTQEEKGA